MQKVEVHLIQSPAREGNSAQVITTIISRNAAINDMPMRYSFTRLISNKCLFLLSTCYRQISGKFYLANDDFHAQNFKFQH